MERRYDHSNDGINTTILSKEGGGLRKAPRNCPRALESKASSIITTQVGTMIKTTLVRSPSIDISQEYLVNLEIMERELTQNY